MNPEQTTATDLSACTICKGKGVVDENGNPYVWGRADSYECLDCDGTGNRYGIPPPEENS